MLLLYTQISADSLYSKLGRKHLFPLAETYSVTSAQNQHIAGRLLLGQVISILNRPISDLQKIEYTAFGKPFIAGGLNFNISHSGKMVVCVASSNQVVGVDVELIKPIVISDFKQELYSEFTAVQDCLNPIQSFFRIWTQKEAVIKADGRGMQIGMDNVYIEQNRAFIRGEDKIWYLNSLDFLPSYSISVCSENYTAKILTQEISIEALINAS